jgi:hypothetical protein
MSNAPLYPVASPGLNGISQGLFPFDVSRQIFKEWVQLTPFFSLMGNELTRPIVRHKIVNGNGYQYRVPKINSLDHTKPVRNFNQVSGSGQYQSVDYDSVNVEGKSFLVDIKGRQLLSTGTPISLPDYVRGQLIEVCQLNFHKCLLDAAMFDYDDNTNSFAGYNPTTQMPSYDRVALAGATTTRATYNGRASIQAQWADLSTGVTYENNGLSAKHLLKLKTIAARGGNTDGAVLTAGKIEDPIRPAFMKSKGGWAINEYIYLCNTESYTQLLQDPMYYQSTLTRGVIVSDEQPQSISGALYKGMYEGIHIYETKDLASYITTTGGKTVAWELFIGAGAWSAGWDKEPWFAYKEDVTNMTAEYTSHEIRGEKALKFKAKQASTLVTAVAAKTGGVVEQGIIHSFVRLA